MTIIIVNNDGESLKVVNLSTKTMDKIIEVLYPMGVAGNSKGYIELVNHLYKK